MTRPSQPTRLRRALGACLVAWVALTAPARAESAPPALASSPLSIATLDPGQYSIVAVAGFPYLSVGGAFGVVPGFDVGLQVRAAWSEIQRLNVQARVRLLSWEDAALGLRLSAGTWMSRPASPLWIDFTGEQDYSGLAGLAYTLQTPSGTLLTFEGSVLGIGTTRPSADPLGGPPPAIGWGANGQLRVAAELPHESGLRFAFEVGLDLHTAGFDGALAMPFFGLGVGYVVR